MRPRLSWGLWVAFCSLALLLYWPTLSVGLLSDDFVLWQLDSHWKIGPVTPILFRPLPLLLWAVLNHVGVGASGLHLLNVLLHGTNAYLMYAVSRAHFEHRSSPLIAGVLFVTLPVLPEAVVWCSGVFDVLATTCVLLSVLVAQQYGPRPSTGTRASLFLLALAALATKETAVVLPLLVGLDALARRTWNRILWRDLFALTVCAGVYAALRALPLLGPTDTLSLTRYQFQRALFAVFGTFAVPWTSAELSVSVLPVLGALIVIALLIGMFCKGDRGRLAVPVSAALWSVVAILPLAPVMFVGSDLEASRYLYLPAAGWSLLLCAAAEPPRSHGLVSWRGWFSGLLCLLAMLNIYALGQHLAPWQEAGRTRDAVERAAASQSAMRQCRTVRLLSVPDSINGAYVFRNGLVEAFARDVGITVVQDDSATCTFAWNQTTGHFSPER